MCRHRRQNYVAAHKNGGTDVRGVMFEHDHRMGSKGPFTTEAPARHKGGIASRCKYCDQFLFKTRRNYFGRDSIRIVSGLQMASDIISIYVVTLFELRRDQNNCVLF